jgi:phosphatidylglycerophosphatase C
MTRQVLAVFDLDETLTVKDTLVPYLLLALRRHPAMWLRCMGLPFNLIAYLLGLRNRAWLKERFLRGVLGGRTKDEIARINKEFISGLMKDGLNRQVLSLLEMHHAQGHRLVLLSASPDCYVNDIGLALGFTDTIATRVDIAGDSVTGYLAGPNLKGPEKVLALENELGEQLPDYELTAYGDDVSDQNLLAMADHGYWVRRTPELERLARELDIGFIANGQP